ncbi:MAG: LemA family protein [Candidatus Aquicultorales bacterium]
MESVLTAVGAIAAFVILALLYVMYLYNLIVRQKNHSEEAWSDIEVQLKRRHDLIGNVVETVKGYAAHEEDVLESVTDSRTKALGAVSVTEQQEAENMLTGALKSLFAVAENYPNLKANENFALLQGQLVETEDKLELARGYYNANVREYNILLESFPTNVVGSWFGFEGKTYFDIEETEEEPVTVSFSA